MQPNAPQPPNPYEAPTPAGDPPGGLTPEGWQPCPSCGNTSATMPSFTWWGGVIGHKMLTHVICDKCSTGYNGKTGKPNTTGIVIYSLVVAGLLVAVLWAIDGI